MRILPFSRVSRLSTPKCRFLLLVLIFFALFVVYYGSSVHQTIARLGGNSHTVHFIPVILSDTKPAPSLKVTKASMLYGPPNYIYEKALESHVQHNELHGYGMHVLRNPIIKGFSNKLLWLQQLISEELQREDGQRSDWIMYFDPSIILLNHQKTLERFLPPAEDIQASLSIIATKPDGDNISTRVFFIGVSPLALRILSKAITAPLLDPGRDWGPDITSSSLQAVLERPEHRESAVYQPTHWYNHLTDGEATIPDDTLLVRFPAELQGRRWKLMDELLASLPARRLWLSKYKSPPEYPTGSFWQNVAEAKRVSKKAEESARGMDPGSAKEEVLELVQKLRDCAELRAWDETGLVKAVDELKRVVRWEP